MEDWRGKIGANKIVLINTLLIFDAKEFGRKSEFLSPNSSLFT